jgi:hypothetical protein
MSRLSKNGRAYLTFGDGTLQADWHPLTGKGIGQGSSTRDLLQMGVF